MAAGTLGNSSREPPRPLTPSSPTSWGRWREILSHGRFKRRLSERDVETICRAILVYCLLHYRGDENIKGFIWDLISPTENGKAKELQNHSGEGLQELRDNRGPLEVPP